MLLLLACAPKPPPPQPDILPRLPAPRGDVYARVPSRPADAVVARLLGDRPWDESLSGAAGALALATIGRERTDVRALRWKLVLAGYPHAVTARHVATTPHGALPDTLSAPLAEHRGDVGLARARADDADTWMLLLSPAGAALPRIPREVDRGAVLDAPRIRAADPFGSVRPETSTLTFDTDGEWLVSIDGVATLPVYVGVTTPAAPPLPAGDPAGEGVVDVAATVIAELREWYGHDPAEEDAMLASVARGRLRDLLAGSALPDASVQLRAAGFVGEPAAVSECRAPTVVDCLDGMWWSVPRRAPLTGGFRAVGIAGEGTADGVALVVAAAG